jgi:vesicle transport through interaction with t-SNAREs 1
MDVEFRTMVGNDKKTASQKVSDYRDEYKSLLQTFQKTKQNAESLALKSGSTARTKLMSANQRLDQSTATLESSRQLIAQTENIGSGIIGDLESQSEQLKHASSNTQEIKQFTFDAKLVLRSMGRRAVIHNLCMMFTILVLFGIICVIIYYGFVEKKK